VLRPIFYISSKLGVSRKLQLRVAYTEVGEEREQERKPYSSCQGNNHYLGSGFLLRPTSCVHAVVRAVP
jgi:hypothetical protein